MARSEAYAKRLRTIPPFYTLPSPKTVPKLPPAPPRQEVLIGYDVTTGEEVLLSLHDRLEHMLVLGKTGQGKSNYLLHLIRQDILAGRGVTVLDIHGPLLEDTLADMEEVAPHREEDTILIDLGDTEWPVGLNFFSRQGIHTAAQQDLRVGQIVAAFQKAWGATWGILMQDWLTTIANTFLDAGFGTMADIPDLLHDARFRARFLPHVRNLSARAAWASKVSPKTGAVSEMEIGSLSRRLNLFLSKSSLTNIVGQTKTTLDIPGWIEGNKIVLIKLPIGDMDEETVRLVGTLLVQLLFQAAMGRARGAPPHFIYADEFQHVASPDLVKLIMNVRKYGVGCILATQRLGNIEDADVREGLLGVGNLVAFQTTAKDAAILASELRLGPPLPEDEWEGRPTRAEVANRLVNLKGLLGTGRAVCKLSGREATVEVPLVAAPPPEYTRSMRSRIQARSRQRYCRPRWEVEREIRERIGEGLEGQECAAPTLSPPPVPPEPAIGDPSPQTHSTRRRTWITPSPDVP